VLQLIWFSVILRVAYRVITGRGAEDARSDDEEYVYFVFVSFQTANLPDPPVVRTRTRRKTNDPHGIRFPHSTGYARGCLPSLPYTLLFPFCTQYTLDTVRGSKCPGTGELRRVTGCQCDSIASHTSPPAATVPRGLCVFSFVIYAYIPFRSRRN
jgi:hypothetical protein